MLRNWPLSSICCSQTCELSLISSVRFAAQSILIQILLISEGKQSWQVQRRSGSLMSAVPLKSLLKFDWLLKEISLGSCRGDLEASWSKLNWFLKEMSLDSCREDLQASSAQLHSNGSILTSVPFKSLLKLNWFLKEMSLGSCRGDLKLLEPSSIQILIQIQSRQL